MMFAIEPLSQSDRDNFQLLFFRPTGTQTRVNLCLSHIRRKGYEHEAYIFCHADHGICPNCKSEMTVTEAAPVLLTDHLETITYRCKVCRSELKHTFAPRSEVWKPL